MFTFTGTLEDHGGNPHADSEVLLIPSVNVTVDPVGNVVHIGNTTAKTDENGYFSADLVAGEGLTYTVRSVGGGPLRPQRFAAPADNTTLDLADVTPIPAPSPMSPMVRGASAYELAVAAGFDGTEAEWLASLRGANGLLSLTPTATPGVLQIGA